MHAQTLLLPLAVTVALAQHHVAPRATTSAAAPSRTVDLAACQHALDTLIHSISLIPTPNAALGGYLATETKVPNACSWVADAPASLGPLISAFSTDVLAYLKSNAADVAVLKTCVDISGSSVTRAEIVTPYFAMDGCTAGASASTTASSGSTFSTAAASTNSKPSFPTPTSTSTNAARGTGVAVAGVAAGVLLGVVGVL